MVERVGEQSAHVCHCVYMRPLSASRCSVGMLMRPPYGDHAARPVSSYSTSSTFGEPSGGCFGMKGPQSEVDCRLSSVILPLYPGGGAGVAKPRVALLLPGAEQPDQKLAATTMATANTDLLNMGRSPFAHGMEVERTADDATIRLAGSRSGDANQRAAEREEGQE